MGLIIKSTETKKIGIQGLSYQPSSVYARLRFICHFDGLSVETDLSFYETKENFKSTPENQIPVLIEKDNSLQVINKIDFKVDLLEGQSVDTMHNHAKIALESLGYEVTIDLL